MLAIVVPVTQQVKGYPFEVALPKNLPIAGVVLADQLKSLDWRAREIKHVASLARDDTSRDSDKNECVIARELNRSVQLQCLGPRHS